MKSTFLKKALAVAMSLTMVAAMAACGTENDGQGEAETLVVVTEPTFPPFDTTDENGNLIGYDMDLISAIAEDQGFKVTFRALEFEALIPAVQSKSADIIAAGMNSEDPERREKVDFSDPYYESGLVMIVSTADETLGGIEDLTPDMKVASQIGTTGADKALALKSEGKIKDTVILNGFDTCVMQVINGNVNAAIIDAPVAKSYIEKQPGKIKIVGETMNAENYAFAVQKGNSELLEKINAGFNNIKENGKFAEITAKWLAD